MIKVKVKMMMKIPHKDSPEGTYALDYGALWAQLLKIFNTRRTTTKTQGTVI